MNFVLFLTFLIIKESWGQEYLNEYSNTTNSCFYSRGKSVQADEITRLPISGSQTDSQIATCCTLCRSLFDCVAWEFDTSIQTCIFFKNVKNVYSSQDTKYLGKKLDTEFWKCNSQKDKWYYDNSIWVQKTNATSKESRAACCHDCFWSQGCVSWMHYENTNDCYHSTRNLNTSPSAGLVGMYAGMVSYAFSPYEPFEI
jgi:hypothetical protein